MSSALGEKRIDCSDLEAAGLWATRECCSVCHSDGSADAATEAELDFLGLDGVFLRYCCASGVSLSRRESAKALAGYLAGWRLRGDRS